MEGNGVEVPRHEGSDDLENYNELTANQSITGGTVVDISTSPVANNSMNSSINTSPNSHSGPIYKLN